MSPDAKKTEKSNLDNKKESAKSESKKDKSKSTVLKSTLIWTAVTLGVIALLIAAAAAGVYAYEGIYNGKIYPGVKVLNIRLDGLTPDEARVKLIEAVDDKLEKGLIFTLDGEQKTLQVSAGSDVPDIIRYDIYKAVDDAYLIGRKDARYKILYEILRARLTNYRVPVGIEIDENRLTDALSLLYAEKLPAPVDANFEIDTSFPEDGPDVMVIPDKDGAQLDMQGVIEKLKQQAEILDFQTIILHVTNVKAAKQATDLQAVIHKVEEVLARPELELTFEDQTFKVPVEEIATWIITGTEDDSITLDETAFASSVRALAKDVEVQSKSGKMEVKDGKIVSFTAGTLGKKINIAKTLEPILTSWPPSSTFPLVVEEEVGQITGSELDEFGIKELIGVGRSNFRGSPYNRTQNIKKAVHDHVNGTLIAPGEEFSMLKTLGEIDGAHGWLPELVIKGDKTTPEYGGGLCQIGTTMFRSAVDTGLKVTERRNHSYRVSYYEPAGTDATIYEPSPDFRFLNDTQKHIYINAYIVGTEVVFEMWGTSDGRKVETSDPEIYNIRAAPATKLIETTDLAPGKKKCTESAHAGADAHFTTKITYANGEVREETFRSHYRPWGAVCLIGVEQLSNPEGQGDAAQSGADNESAPSDTPPADTAGE
ncbi:MAG: VanW family protein [Patescibacteria group bacterium]